MPRTKLSSMPYHIRSAADFLAKFIEMEASHPIVEHQANILRSRIDTVLESVAIRDGLSHKDEPTPCMILKCKNCGLHDDEAEFRTSTRMGERICPNCGSAETYPMTPPVDNPPEASTIETPPQEPTTP